MFFTILIFLALGGGLIAAWKRPPVAVALLLCMFGIEQYAQSVSPFFVQHPIVINAVVAFAVLIALLKKHWKTRLHRIYYGDVGLAVIILFAYAAISTLWSPIPDVSLKYYLGATPYLVLFVVVAPLIIVATKDMYEMLEALVVIGALVSFVLLFFTEWEGRGVVLAGNEDADWHTANPLAASEMAGYMGLAAAFLPLPARYMQWDVARWALVLLAIALAIKTGSRGQTVFLLVSLAVFYVMRTKFTVKGLVSVLLPAILVAFIFQYAIDLYWADSDRWGDEMVGHALEARTSMAAQLLHSWWRGGGFTFLFGLGNTASFDPNIAGFYPHVVPLEILAEEGLVGFLVFIVITYLVGRSFLKVMDLKSPKHSEIALLLGALFLYALLLSFKQGSLVGGPSLFLFAALTGRWYLISKMSVRVRGKQEVTQ